MSYLLTRLSISLQLKDIHIVILQTFMNRNPAFKNFLFPTILSYKKINKNHRTITSIFHSIINTRKYL